MQKSILGKNLELAAATLSCIGDGVISTDLAGRIIYMNQIAEEITECEATEAIGHYIDNVFTIFNGDTIEPIKSPIMSVIKQDDVSGLPNNTILISKGGVRKYVSATCSTVKSEQEAVIGAVMIVRDITRLKTLEMSRLDEENNLKTIFNYAPVGMITLNEEGIISQINEAALLLTTKKKEQVIGTRFGNSFNCAGSFEDERGCGYGLKCTDCQIRKAVDLVIEHRQASGNIELLKTLIFNEKLTEFWFRASVTPIVVNGRVNAVITALDITERKKAEEGLRRYKMLSENANDIMLFIDMEGRIIEANRAAVKAYGYTYEELCSLNISDIREDWSYTRLQMEEANKTGLFFEANHRRKDGSFFQVEVSSQGTYMGDKRILLSIIRDITERKQAERKIFESQTKYRSLFMNMHNGYSYYKIVYSHKKIPIDLEFIEVNEAFEKISGMTKKHIIGKRYTELFPQNKDLILEKIQNSERKLASGDSIHINETYSNSSDKWYSIAIYSPQKDYIVMIVTDISNVKESQISLKRSKEVAEAANKAKSEFLANMSHEIRTPINGIVGMIDLTLLTELNEDQRDNLVTAKSCANSLLKIINDVLDFSKMEAGKLSIENVNFNIKELVEEIVKMHSPRVLEKELELNYMFSGNIPSVLVGDPNRLRQVLNNLISNAMKFTDRGQIDISVKKTGGCTADQVELQFTVADTGIGIAHEDIGQLFKSFNQLDGSFTKQYGGTGLGLAISKQLVQIMGGKIWVESAVGKGSSFSFILKFKIGKQVIDKTKLLSKVVKTSKPLKILLAEDDFINQKVILKMLKEKGHVVDIVSNGKEALVLLKQIKYDAVLMDIQMPEMDGIEATRRIREGEQNGEHTPIIAITAYALQGDKERFLTLGMDGYISKPVQMDNLFHTIDTITSSTEYFTPDRVVITESGEVAFCKELPQKRDVKIYIVLYKIEEYIREIELALKNNDLIAIETIAHIVKDMFIEIDAVELKDTAFKIELAARKCNLEDTAKYVNIIKDKFNFYKESIV